MIWGEMSRQFRVVAVIVASAAIAFVVYQHYHRPYRNSVVGGPSLVLVAKKQIPKGTMGNVIRTRSGYYKLAFATATAIRNDAITDASVLVGKVAVKNIPAGRPLIAADFGALGKRRVLFPKTTP